MLFAFWSFEGYCWFGLLMLCWFAWSIGSAAKDAAKIVKKVAENEAVQDAGKGLLARWLDSVFK